MRLWIAALLAVFAVPAAAQQSPSDQAIAAYQTFFQGLPPDGLYEGGYFDAVTVGIEGKWIAGTYILLNDNPDPEPLAAKLSEVCSGPIIAELSVVEPFTLQVRNPRPENEYTVNYVYAGGTRFSTQIDAKEYLEYLHLTEDRWYVYIWAVNANHILDASLGYFINPLMNVVLGVVLLGERLRSGQWLAVAVAASGVAYLTWTLGQLPWVALVLAATFATYGVLKKKAPLPAEQGMMLETATLFIPALMTLLWLDWGGDGALVSGDWFTVGLLLLSGPLTVIPLMLFASAAKVVALSTLGILQYLAPTGQFLVGVFIFGETVTPERLLGFAIIWSALLIFWLEGWRNRRARAAIRVAQAV